MRRRPLNLVLYLCFFLPAAFLMAAFQIGDAARQTTVLYDGRLGDTPNEQGFNFLAFGPTSTQLPASQVTVLDTTVDISEQAGYFSRDELVLDRRSGYTLQFTIQLGQEEHLSKHRAGFSVIILSDDLLGLELGFWENEIWVQEGGAAGNLFKHAEGVVFDTTAGQTSYELSILNDTYTLAAGGAVILSGPLRDYTAFEGFPDVYETPGFLFLGDNSRRAAAKTAISYVALETAPLSAAAPTVTLMPEPSAAPALEPSPTATDRPTLEPAATASPTAAYTPTTVPATTPRPADKLYLWMSCLKGVDVGMRQ